MPIISFGDDNDNTPTTYSELQKALKETKKAFQEAPDKGWQKYYQGVIEYYSEKLKELDENLGVRNCGGAGNYKIEKDA